MIMYAFYPVFVYSEDMAGLGCIIPFKCRTTWVRQSMEGSPHVK